MALGKDPALPSAFAMTLGKELKELKKIYIYKHNLHPWLQFFKPAKKR